MPERASGDFGQDFARNGDVSPVVFGQRDESMRRVARFLLEMRNVPFKDQELILNWIISRVPMFACGKMDARGNGSALAEAMQQRWGFDRVEAVQTSEKTYLALAYGKFPFLGVTMSVDCDSSALKSIHHRPTPMTRMAGMIYSILFFIEKARYFIMKRILL